MYPPTPYYPTLEALGFSAADLTGWRVPREAAESFVRGLVVGYSFDEARSRCRPPITSLTFALALAQRVVVWRSGGGPR